MPYHDPYTAKMREQKMKNLLFSTSKTKEVYSTQKYASKKSQCKKLLFVQHDTRLTSRTQARPQTRFYQCRPIPMS